jgi:lipoprotein-releasing system permease protein
MFSGFCKYFFRYIFLAKTRQRLLFLAIVGLFLSSFALIVLQSSMGGLQNKLIKRSKGISGNAVIIIKNDMGKKQVETLIDDLFNYQLNPVIEYEIELLLRSGKFIAPMVLHGISKDYALPEFIDNKKQLDTLSVGYDLARKLHIIEGEEVQIISPSHVNSIMGDIPRQATIEVGKILITNVPEVDSFHGWVKLKTIQNLIRKRSFNRLRIFIETNHDELTSELISKYGDKVELQTWEAKNRTLVWALKLETMVMVFLFIAMTLLVSLCITSGLLIFFDKIKGDLTSFWILGSSKKQLEKASFIFLTSVSFMAVMLGLVSGLIFLYFFHKYGGNIMPDVFVDRKIPIQITAKGLILSFSVPFVISMFFSYFSLSQFKKETDYLEHVRSL